MSDTAILRSEGVAPRRRDAAATRALILKAAQAQFAQLGYDRAALRDIAGEAACDVALIKRYFGGKEGLFIEALKGSFAQDGLRSWNRDTFAQDIAERMAESAHTGDDATLRFQFLLRTATSPTTAPLLSVAIQQRFLAPISEWIGGNDAEVRARVVAGVFIGLLVERLIRNEPLVGHEREVFVANVKAAISALVPLE